MKLGLIGAGTIGKAVARLSVAAGHQAMLSNSRGPDTIRIVASSIGCEAGTVEEAAAFGDILVVAIPFFKINTLNSSLFADKIVIDANNYSPKRDDVIDDIAAKKITVTGLFQQTFPEARVVKAFNTIFATELVAGKQTLDDGKTRALPISGDDKEAKAVVSKLLRDFGYDVVDAGSISESWRLDMGKPASGLAVDADDLRAALADAERDVDVPMRSWRRKQ